MPAAPERPCLQPGCGAYAVQRGRCEEHAQARVRQLDAHRGSSTQRGYDARWQSFRAWFIRRHPLCEDCREEGRLTATKEVHHLRKVKDHPELRLVESNCRALCTPHHSARTARGE